MIGIYICSILDAQVDSKFATLCMCTHFLKMVKSICCVYVCVCDGVTSIVLPVHLNQNRVVDIPHLKLVNPSFKVQTTIFQRKI